MRIVNGGDAARQHGPAGCGATIKRPRPKLPYSFHPFGTGSRYRHQMEQLAVKREHVRRVGVAQFQRGGRDRVEYRLGVGRRTREDAQDLAGGGLLLERFAQFPVARLQFVEEPNVLDRDHRLISKSLQKRKLSFRKRARLAPSDGDSADRFAFAHQGNANCAAEAPSRGTLGLSA